jgi:hypothetical protein
LQPWSLAVSLLIADQAPGEGGLSQTRHPELDFEKGDNAEVRAMPTRNRLIGISMDMRKLQHIFRHVI